jgi:hypothetical protein
VAVSKHRSLAEGILLGFIGLVIELCLPKHASS